MTDSLMSALHTISPEDRDTWITVGMAIHAELGSAGWSIWATWSRGSDRYREADARAVWRSFKGSGIGIGSLYHLAQEAGWQGEIPPLPQARHSLDAARRQAEREAEEHRSDERAAHTATRAIQMIAEASYDIHPYLAAKGFPLAKGLVSSTGLLLVPMWGFKTGEMQTLQTIFPDGEKKFLPGGRAGGAVFRIGRGGQRWWCEGLATGLSIQAALRTLYRQDEVVVCFSAGNLKLIAKWGNVIADNDASGVGEKAARDTGLRYWMPPDVGTDANDYAQRLGARALADELRKML